MRHSRMLREHAGFVSDSIDDQGGAFVPADRMPQHAILNVRRMLVHTQVNLAHGVHPFVPDNDPVLRLLDPGQVVVAPKAPDAHGTASQGGIVQHRIVLGKSLAPGVVEHLREAVGAAALRTAATATTDGALPDSAEVGHPLGQGHRGDLPFGRRRIGVEGVVQRDDAPVGKFGDIEVALGLVPPCRESPNDDFIPGPKHVPGPAAPHQAV